MGHLRDRSQGAKVRTPCFPLLPGSWERRVEAGTAGGAPRHGPEKTLDAAYATNPVPVHDGWADATPALPTVAWINDPSPERSSNLSIPRLAGHPR